MSHFDENHPISSFVDQYKLYLRGTQGTMTSDRIKKLNELGFVWDPRKAEQKPNAVGSPDTDDDYDENDDENDDDNVDDDDYDDYYDYDNIDSSGSFSSS